MFKKALLVLLLAISNAHALEHKVTNGSVSVVKVITETKTFNVESATTRIDFTDSTGERLKLISTYLGPSNAKIPLASGAVVEQYGIKLRSVDTCNLVYVMRSFAPTPILSISYKLNKDMNTHEQCGARGYNVVKNITMPSRPVGSQIVLEAYFEPNNILVVKENDTLVWKGLVDFSQTGVSGFRSDNVKVMFSAQ